MEERLKFIFSNVNDWLKFAEAKNGVLIGFNGASIWGLLQTMEEIRKIAPYLNYFCYFCIAMSFVSIVVSLFSFMPSIALSKKEVDKIAEVDIKKYGTIFFRDIAHFNPEDFLRLLYQRQNLTQMPENFNSFELDLAYQTIHNARTTWNKYQTFFIALNTTLAGMVIPIPFQIWFWYLKRQQP